MVLLVVLCCGWLSCLRWLVQGKPVAPGTQGRAKGFRAGDMG